MAQVLKIKAFCRTHAEQGVPFSVAGMYAAYLPVQLVHTEGTFCSKHVTMALQYAMLPEVMQLNPALVTPTLLHKVLTSQRAIVNVVPSKLTLDREKCVARMLAAGRVTG